MSIVSSTEYLAYLQVNGQSVTTAGQTLLGILQPMVESAISKFLGWRVVGASSFTSVTEFQPRKGDRGWTAADWFAFDLSPGGQVVPRQYNRADLSIIQLDRLPVRAITSVYINTAGWMGGDANGTFPSTTLMSATEYHLDVISTGISWTGHVIRNFGNWPAWPMSTKITYTAGLTEDELNGDYSAIKLVALEELADAYRAAMARANAALQGGPIQSVGIEDFSTSIGVSDVVAAGGAQYGLSRRSKQLLEGYINYNKFIGR